MPNAYQLTEGSLQTIMRGGDIPNPIMQVLGSKKINSGTPDKERYRILLSDGQNSISFAMLTTQINDKVGSGGIKNNTVIKLKRYITSVINNNEKKDTRVLLILDLDIIADGDEVGSTIGNPSQLTSDNLSSNSTASTTATKPTISRSGTPTVSSTNDSSANTNRLNTNGSFDNHIISPISSLSPYHNKWVIKARITNKSNVRTWSNSRGEGKLFSIDLVDESGEIRCTAFRDLVDKFYDILEVDKVYYISKCQLKPANKQFSTIKNDYEMTMVSDTIIEECLNDDSVIPQTKYDFTSIDKIATTEVGTVVDVIGVCKSVSDLQTFVARSTGRELKKKEVILVDQSNSAVSLTLWGTQAETFDGTNNPVVVIKSAKVGEFGGGKNLATAMTSLMKINPDMPECHRLKGWYDREGNCADVSNISAKTGAGNFTTPWMTFQEVQDQGLGQSERGDYYQIMGTILLIRSENAVYKSCPREDCNKKVIDLENDMYRCEKCNQEYPNFKYRLLVSMNVGDWTGNQWMTLFSSEAEKILSKTAQEVGQALENDPETAIKIFETANFKQFIFKCRSKMETYNDEARLKTVAIKVDPINYEDYNSYLSEKIQQFIA